MQSKTLFFPVLMALLYLPGSARAESGEEADHYTLQVAAFPDRAPARDFISQIEQAGEQPFWGTAELPGRGRWVRVFIGSFATAAAARRYGQSLVERRVIKEFLVRESRETRSLSRPRTITLEIRRASPVPGWPFVSVEAPGPESAEEVPAAATMLPEVRAISASLAPPVDTGLIPRPDPVRMAFKMAAGEIEAGITPRKGGGLRLGGDMAEGLDRLRWIAGPENACAILLDGNGRASIDAQALAKASGAAGLPPSAATLVLADYINSNDGLLLLVQMIYGQHNYLLHIGRRAPTAGEEIEITGSLNLDNNFDTRINPYRRFGRKLARELPPEGFDGMIAINPVARWFNLHTNQMVPIGHITFHELAELHAKIALGLNYLGQASRPGAHNVAIERERRLKSQRPLNEIVLTAGSNRVLRSLEEIRRFTSETTHVSGQR